MVGIGVDFFAMRSWARYVQGRQSILSLIPQSVSWELGGGV